jgi:hypothetical protein
VASCKGVSCKVASCKVASCKVASCKVASCMGIVITVGKAHRTPAHIQERQSMRSYWPRVL